MAIPAMSVDSATVQTRIMHVSPGFIKEGGVKTDKPLIDAETQKRVWWGHGKFFPHGSQGGEDAEQWFAILSDDCPIELQYGETPLVELIDASVRIENHLSLVCAGVKRAVVGKAAK